MIGIGNIIGNKQIYNYQRLADTHYNRVIADGGIIPSKTRLTETIQYLSRRSNSEYALISDPHIFGYKIGGASDKVSKLYSLLPESDLSQTTLANQPLVLPHNGADNYWSNQGVNGNFISTPHSTNNAITGDLEIVVKLSLNDWTGLNESVFVGKYGYFENKRQWRLLRPSGINSIYLIVDFANGTGATDVVTWNYGGQIPNGTTIYLKATYIRNTGSGQYEGKIYSSLDGTNWTLRNTKTAATITTSSLDAPILIGATGSNSTNAGSINGKIYWVKVYNGLQSNGGTLAVNFDANDFRKASPTNQTSWVAGTTGETWTIYTDTATTGYKGVLVNRTLLQMDGTDDNLKTIAMTLNQPVSMYLGVNVLNGVAALRRVIDGLSGGNLIKFDTATQISISNGINLNYTSFPASNYKKRILYSSIHSSPNSILQLNGSTIVSGDSGTQQPGGFTIASDRGNVNYINAIYATIIATRTADTTQQRNDMQNFINTLNGGLY